MSYYGVFIDTVLLVNWYFLTPQDWWMSFYGVFIDTVLLVNLYLLTPQDLAKPLLPVRECTGETSISPALTTRDQITLFVN